MYRNTSMVGLKCQIKPTMMVLFMGTLKWLAPAPLTSEAVNKAKLL